MASQHRRRRLLRFGTLLVAVLAAALGSAAAASGLGAGARTGSPRRASARELGPNTTNVASANAVAIDGNGRVLVGGTCCTRPRHAGILARYTPGGRLDRDFGHRGEVTTPFGHSGSVNDVAIDGSGRIVVGGGTNLIGKFALARYRPDGSLDRTFGSSGAVRTGNFAFFDGADIEAIAIDASGRIIAAGNTRDNGSGPGAVAVARYNPDGRLDPTFGTAGKVVISFPGLPPGGSSGNAVTIDASGKIVVAGGAASPSPEETSNDDFALARLTPSGELDPTFGSDGEVRTDFGGGSSDFAADLAIDPAGEIVAAGGGGDGAFALARYTPSGALDPAFGSGGIVTTGFRPGCTAQAGAVAIDPSGRVLAAGGACGATTHHGFALTRYMPGGTLNPSFGSGGKVTTNFEANHADFGADLAIAPSGDIVAVGAAGAAYPGGEPAAGTGDRFALARYTPSGALDRAFGSGGKVRSTFLPATEITGVRMLAKARGATFKFRAIGPATGFECALASPRQAERGFDGCRSPKSYRHLKPGRYRFEVAAKVPTGLDPTPARRAFGVAPNTRITRAQVNPSGRMARFRFDATGEGNSFRCKLRRRGAPGKTRFGNCRSPKSYSHLGPGRYTFAVKALGPGGRDETPAKRKFGIG